MISLFLGVGLFGQEGVLKIGYVDSDPAGIISKTSAFTTYMGKALSGSGITSATTVVAKDVNEMAALIRTGKVDLYIDTLFPAFLVSKQIPLDLSFRRWKKGVGEYKTIFLAKKTSTLTSLSGLGGKRIGFEDPSSTSGRYLPQLTLFQQKYQFTDLSQGDKPLGNTIGYVFTGSADNTPVWLMQGKIDVGVISSNDYDEMAPGLKNNLKIIGETDIIPRQLITLRSNLSPGLKAQIKTVLLNLDKSPEGQAMLTAWEKTSRVDEVTPAMAAVIKNLEAQLKASGL